MKIPRTEYPEVKAVLQEEITREEKAVKILKFHKDMTARECDGRMPPMPTAQAIEKALEDAGF